VAYKRLKLKCIYNMDGPHADGGKYLKKELYKSYNRGREAHYGQ